MNDAGRVRRREPFQELVEQVRHLLRGHALLALDPLPEALALEVFHHHEAVAVGQVAEVEHLDDVLGSDAAGGLRFALEPLHHVGLRGDGSVEHLDRHLAMDADVLAFVDGAHTAFAQQADDAVLPFDRVTRLQAHRGLLGKWGVPAGRRPEANRRQGASIRLTRLGHPMIRGRAGPSRDHPVFQS